METLLSIILGIGLSTACGFRIFVPLLVMSIASMSGHLSLSSGFEWIGTEYAAVAFGVATVLEVGAYFIPWLDNALDTIATPAAIVAGTVVMASVVEDVSPFLRWTLALIAGGGAAGIVQGTTTVVRAGSTTTTGGLGNPVVATGELVGATGVSVLAIALPVAGVLAVTAIVLVLVRKVKMRASSRPVVSSGKKV
jgi:hypothetical protein